MAVADAAGDWTESEIRYRVVVVQVLWSGLIFRALECTNDSQWWLNGLGFN